MKHLALHILQSFPVACLNRDDLNSPKTAIFGGVQRARVSSQSWKRAIRELAKEQLPQKMKGERTRLLIGALVKKLTNQGLPENVIPILAEMAAEQISKIDSKKDADGYYKVTTLCFLSDEEFGAIVEAMVNNDDLKKAASDLSKLLITPPKDEDEAKKKIEKARKACEKLITKDSVGKAIKSVQLKDAADIALFGRMVANDHSLTVEGAAMFSHALSTHKVDNEIDFFSAVDDLQPKEDAGAGMTGTLEFNSATYYRFAALNLDMLKDKEHLGTLSPDERKEVVKAFVKATLMAIPGARKNSMNANTFPGFVLGIVQKEGHPVQLVNAFEKPAWSKGGKGLFENSVEMLKTEYEQLKTTWGLQEDAKAVIPEKTLEDFLKEVIQHVE